MDYNMGEMNGDVAIKEVNFFKRSKNQYLTKTILIVLQQDTAQIIVKKFNKILKMQRPIYLKENPQILKEQEY